MNKTTRYSPEIRERAVRMVFEHQAEYDSQWASAEFDCGQGWLHGGDVAKVGSTGWAGDAQRRCPCELRGRSAYGGKLPQGLLLFFSLLLRSLPAMLTMIPLRTKNHRRKCSVNGCVDNERDDEPQS